MMSRGIALTFAAVCIILLVATAGTIVYCTSVVSDRDSQISALKGQITSLGIEVHRLNDSVNELNAELSQKNSQVSSLNSQIANLNSQIEDLNSQVANLSSQTSSRANLDVSSFTVQDDRSRVPYTLHVSGRVYNTGASTAYNAFLHVVAFNAESKAIDSFHSFTGITPGVSLGLDFRLNYTGSPIQRWSITPIWTDRLVTGSSGTFTGGVFNGTG